jgi:hypothetical protein
VATSPGESAVTVAEGSPMRASDEAGREAGASFCARTEMDARRKTNPRLALVNVP